MKITSYLIKGLLFLSSISPLFLLAAPVPTEPGVVTYNPVLKIAQGNQPYTETYQMLMTMPANVVPGSSLPITLDLSVLSKPAGVSAPTALSYVTLSPSVITANAPGQIVPVTISISVPVGSEAGGYGWKILTRGWPVSLPGGVVDAGHTINGLFFPPTSIDNSPPAIVLSSPVNGTVYTYSPLSGLPVTVPVNFSATVGTGGAEITGMAAFINNSPLPVTSSGINSLAASSVGSIQLTAAGNYLISATATNFKGTSEATSEISVVINAPAPVITVASPAVNASYTLTLGSTGVTVPVSVSATSAYGNITSLQATLNGAPLALNLMGINSAQTATGSVNIPVTSPGTYSLVFNATNAYGSATPVTVPFSVVGIAPAPTVTIATPTQGEVFTRTAGSPATNVNYTFSANTSFGEITSVVVKLDGNTINPNLSGLGTATVSGAGVNSFSAPGNHTLTVTASNGSATATASTTFTVRQIQAQLCETLTWLPPISLNKTIQGGSTMPIKFTLTCGAEFVRDTNVVISIYEIFANGSTSTAVLYPYGTGSPNPPDYAITGNKYHLNFATRKGTHRYQIDVYTVANGVVKLLDSKILNTSKKGGKTEDEDDDECDDDDRRGSDCNDHDDDE